MSKSPRFQITCLGSAVDTCPEATEVPYIQLPLLTETRAQCWIVNKPHKGGDGYPIAPTLYPLVLVAILLWSTE